MVIVAIYLVGHRGVLLLHFGLRGGLLNWDFIRGMMRLWSFVNGTTIAGISWKDVDYQLANQLASSRGPLPGRLAMYPLGFKLFSMGLLGLVGGSNGPFTSR